jgi:hypothetical protein
MVHGDSVPLNVVESVDGYKNPHLYTKGTLFRASAENQYALGRVLGLEVRHGMWIGGHDEVSRGLRVSAAVLTNRASGDSWVKRWRKRCLECHYRPAVIGLSSTTNGKTRQGQRSSWKTEMETARQAAEKRLNPSRLRRQASRTELSDRHEPDDNTTRLCPHRREAVVHCEILYVHAMDGRPVTSTISTTEPP